MSPAAWILLLGIILLAAALRLHWLGYDSLWEDEVNTVRDATRATLADMITSGTSITLIATRLFLELGRSEFIVRFSAFIPGLLAIPMAYQVGRQIMGRRGGVILMLLLTLSTSHVRYSQEARYYAFIVFLCLCQMYTIAKALHSRESLKWWLAFGAVTIVATRNHRVGAIPVLILLMGAAGEIGLRVWQGFRAQPAPVRDSDRAYPSRFRTLDLNLASRILRQPRLILSAALILIVGVLFVRAVVRPIALLVYDLPLVQSTKMAEAGIGERIWGTIAGTADRSALLSVPYLRALFSFLGAGPGLALGLYLAAAGIGLVVLVRRGHVAWPFDIVTIAVAPLVFFRFVNVGGFIGQYRHFIFILPFYLLAAASGLEFGMQVIDRAATKSLTRLMGWLGARLWQLGSVLSHRTSHAQDALGQTCERWATRVSQRNSVIPQLGAVLLLGMFILVAQEPLRFYHSFEGRDKPPYRSVTSLLQTFSSPEDLILIEYAQYGWTYYDPDMPQRAVDFAMEQMTFEDLLARYEELSPGSSLWFIDRLGTEPAREFTEWLNRHGAITLIFGNDLIRLSFVRKGRGGVERLNEHAILAKQAVEVEPWNSRLYIELGDVYLQLGNLESALQSYLGAIEADPDNARAYSAACTILLEQARFKEAANLARLGIKRMGDNPDAGSLRVLLADAFRSQGDTLQALAELEHAAHRYPNRTNVQIELALAYGRQGRLQDAVATFEQALAAAPDQAAYILSVLGDFYLRQGRPEDAIAACERIMALPTNPDDEAEVSQQRARGYQCLARVYQAMGDPSRALDYQKQVAELTPDSASSFLNLGYNYRQAGRMDDAEAAFRQALELEPFSEWPRLALADLDRARGNIAQALAQLEDLRQDFPGSAGVLTSLADLYRYVGRTSDALQAYQDALRLTVRNPSIYLGLSQVYLQQGQPDQALATLEQGATLLPTSAPIQRALGDLYARQKRPADAEAAYRRAMALEPGQAGTYAALAGLLISQGRQDEARQLYEQMLTDLPRTGSNLVTIAGGFAALGDADRAETLYRQAIAEFPTQVSAYMGLATLYQGQGRADEAVTLIEQAAQKGVGAAAAWPLKVLGDLYRDRGEVELALSYYDRAARADPSDWSVLRERGNTYRSQGDLEKALADYRRAVELRPGEGRGYQLIGDVLRQQGDLAGAEEAYLKGIEVDPSNVGLYLALGNLYQSQDRGDDAIALYRRLAEVDAFNGNLYLGYALSDKSFAESYIVDQAVAAFQAAAAANPKSGQPYAGLAELYGKRGEYEKMRRYYAQAIEREPDNGEFFYRLAVLTEKGFGVEQALEAYQQAVALNQDNIWYRLGLAQAYHKLGRHDEAIAEAQVAVERWPDSIPARTQLADILAAAGRSEEAAAQFTLVLQRDPGNEYAQKRLQQLTTIGEEQE